MDACRKPLCFVEYRRSGAGMEASMEDRLKGLRILVVDDNDDARRMLMVALDLEGALVTTARSGDEGYEVFQHLRPNVVVSDLSMPDGDGTEFVRKVRALEATLAGRVPAVAVTAYSTEL